MLTTSPRLRPDRRSVSTVTAVGVIIPAKDESTRIRAALESVIASCARVSAPCTIVVVDDASSDDTAQIASDALRSHHGRSTVITVDVGRAGSARRTGVDAFRSDVADPSSAWVLSTDADSVVPPYWVERFMQHHTEGALAVAGVVDLTDDCDGRRIADRWIADYRPTIAADGSHPHVHAANLGVRLDAYDEVGGFRDLDRIEDIDLWDRLRSAGHLPVADASIVVSTSARADGRVRKGFAAALGRLYG